MRYPRLPIFCLGSRGKYNFQLVSFAVCGLCFLFLSIFDGSGGSGVVSALIVAERTSYVVGVPTLRMNRHPVRLLDQMERRRQDLASIEMVTKQSLSSLRNNNNRDWLRGVGRGGSTSLSMSVEASEAKSGFGSFASSSWSSLSWSSSAAAAAAAAAWTDYAAAVPMSSSHTSSLLQRLRGGGGDGLFSSESTNGHFWRLRGESYKNELLLVWMIVKSLIPPLAVGAASLVLAQKLCVWMIGACGPGRSVAIGMFVVASVVSLAASLTGFGGEGSSSIVDHGNVGRPWSSLWPFGSRKDRSNGVGSTSEEYPALQIELMVYPPIANVTKLVVGSSGKPSLYRSSKNPNSFFFGGQS